MNDKKYKLAELLGLDDEGVEALLRQVTWLDDALRRKGISFKDLTDVEDELENLSNEELKKLYTTIGKLLKANEIRATDVGQVGKKTITLTYAPDQEVAEKGFVHPLAQSCEDGIKTIERLRMKIAEKNRELSPMFRCCAEGIEEIQKVRGPNTRRTKGRQGNLSYPEYELTEEGIQRIMEWRREHGE